MIRTKKAAISLIAVIISITVVVTSYIASSGVQSARAAASAYSDVIQDLNKAENFNVEDYPAKANDYSLQVIQIAESTAGELLIYVYQPAAKARKLTATTVRLSQSIGENFAPHDYKLTQLSAQGVFQKYRVEGVTVKSDIVRYYDITAIHRKWINGIDDPSENDNTTNEVVFKVAKLWTACTLGGEVSYGCTYTEVITVTEKYDGFLRYYNGFKFCPDSCDAHYIAFTTDRQMDRLIEAEVEYKAMPKMYGVPMYEEPKAEKAVLSEMDEVSTQADGLFAKKYSWKRIESIAEFKKDKEFSEEAKKGLNGKQWVLSFCETTYTERQIVGGAVERTYTEITEVTVLRLEFEMDGVVYNLGVVDNKQSGDNVPSNTNTGVNFWEWLAGVMHVPVWAAKLIVALVIIAVILILLSVFFPKIRNAIIRMITAPFRWLKKRLTERKKRKEFARNQKLMRKEQANITRYQNKLNRKEIKHENKVNAKERAKTRKKRKRKGGKK